MNLKEITMQELIDELAARDEVELSGAGLYQPYQLIRKYAFERKEVIADCILIIGGKKHD